MSVSLDAAKHIAIGAAKTAEDNAEFFSDPVVSQEFQRAAVNFKRIVEILSMPRPLIDGQAITFTKSGTDGLRLL